MAGRGIVAAAQDAVTNTAGAAAKATTGAVLQAVKSARHLVRGKTATRKTKRKKAKVRRGRKSSRRVAKRAVQFRQKTARRKK